MLAVLAGDSPVLKKLDERHKIAMVNRYVTDSSFVELGRRGEEGEGRGRDGSLASSKLTVSFVLLFSFRTQVQPAENPGSDAQQGLGPGRTRSDLAMIYSSLSLVVFRSSRKESRFLPSFPSELQKQAERSAEHAI